MKRLMLILAVMVALMGAVMVQAQDNDNNTNTNTNDNSNTNANDNGNSNENANANANDNTAEESPAGAWIRFVNFSADGAVDILVNGAPGAINLPALTATEYFEHPVATYTIAAAATGAAVDTTTTGFDFTVEGGARYTVAAVGSTAGGTVQAVVSIDDFSPIPFGSARIYAYHAVEGLGNVDLFANDDMIVTELGFPGTFTDLNGATNDGAFSVDLPAGTYDLSVRLTEGSAVTGLDNANDNANTNDNTDTSNTNTNTNENINDNTTGEDVPGLVDLPGFVIEAGNIYSIAVVGTADNVTSFVTSMAGVAAPQQSALDVALGNPDFSILVAAVRAADPAIGEMLAAEGAWTVFAPTNAAFDAFLNDMAMTTDDLFANTDLLNTVLRYHVLGTSVTAADLGSMSGQTVASVQGEPIAVTVDAAGTITLNGTVNVIGPDISVSSGTVHIVDGVLVPPSVAGQ